MNKQELFEKALNEFDEWPYDDVGMVYCIKGFARHKTGEFSDYDDYDDSDLGVSHWTFICSREEFEAAKAKRKPKPIYTKEMQERGELPVVGMWFVDAEFDGDIKHECLLIHDGDVVYRYDGDYISCLIDDCRPIDTRTAKEKAIDDVRFQLKKLGSLLPINFVELVKDGKIHGVKWVGDENEK